MRASFFAEAQKGSKPLLKAVATALVLIAGAAVVLWYANTLNSWVVGGLIGGLAALLLSIPISLTLFTYLSRRHDERTAAEREVYGRLFPPEYGYQEMSERVGRTLSIGEEAVYPTSRRGVWGEEYENYQDHEEHRDRQIYEEDKRFLPAPERRQLPAPRVSASEQSSAYKTPSKQRGALNSRQLSTRGLQPAQSTETPSRHATTRHLNNPGFPGYQPEMTRGQVQSQALRIARQEATRGHSTSASTQKSVNDRDGRPSSSHGYRRAPQNISNTEGPYTFSENHPRRERRIVDANPSPNSPYRAVLESKDNSSYQVYNYEEPETEVIDPMFATGSLKNPLVRRAPYMYEDDSLRDELAQQVKPPVTRRSSRNLMHNQDEE